LPKSPNHFSVINFINSVQEIGDFFFKNSVYDLALDEDFFFPQKGVFLDVAKSMSFV